MGHFIGLDETKLLDFAEGHVVDDVVLERTAKHVVALAADGQDLDRLALCNQLQCMLACQTDDRGVEAPRQTTLAGRNDQEMNLILACPGQEKRCFGIAGIGSREAGQYLGHTLRIRTGSLGRLLCTAQFRSGDHFHRPGDLLRRLDGGDPVFQILK